MENMQGETRITDMHLLAHAILFCGFSVAELVLAQLVDGRPLCAKGSVKDDSNLVRSLPINLSQIW